MLLRRLAQALAVGFICGTTMLMIWSGALLLYNLDTQHQFRVVTDGVWFLGNPTTFIGVLFLPQYFQNFRSGGAIPVSALWFVLGFVARLVSRSYRTTLFTFVALYAVAYVLASFMITLAAIGLGD
jgi:hypothetical protein